MNAVSQDGAPQQITDRPLSDKKCKRAVEIFWSELSDPRDGVAMHAVVSRRQLLDGARPFEVGRFRIPRELAALDAVADIGIALGEVPRQFAQRPAGGIGSKVVLCWRERLQQFHRAPRLTLPRREKRLELVHRHKTPSLRVENYSTSGRRLVFTNCPERVQN